MRVAKSDGFAYMARQRVDGKASQAWFWLQRCPSVIETLELNMSTQKAVVLIVEDEPLIRFTMLDALEEVGHVVLEAANADEAMVLLRNRTDVDIVFTDVNMAGSMDGIQLAQRVRALRPHIGIIITSGVVRLDPMLLPTRTFFLPKPYQHDTVLTAVHSLLQN
tara:strand:+ start:143 stop:634 length:492 start_codon:yes stop_codon:yes gene_type:complete